MRKALKWTAGIIGLLLAVTVGVTAWMIAMPGEAVPRAPLIEPAQETRMQAQLSRHVQAIAGERHWERPEALEAAARYIEGQLQAMGYQVSRQAVPSKTIAVRNIEARLPGAGTGPTVVIGAHYDSAEGTPAANDNGSGVASLLELARAFAGRKAAGGLADVRLVFYVNEEPPYFQTPMMGSWIHAADLAAKKQPVAAMYSLETMGAYYDAPGSQKFPLPGLSLLYPDTGNFLGFVSDIGARGAVRTAVGAFRETRRLPSEGIAAPAMLEGIDWSDHQSYRAFGYPGVMVTDTAPFRYPHYHMASDTPDKIDYARLARAVLGLRDMFERLYLQPRG